jgi:tetratricopeptide (TPR) repeat protein
MQHPMGGRTALRGLAGLAVGVALAAAVTLPASARGVARVIVAPPLVDAGLVPIARAHRAWLEGRLAAAGVPAGSLSLEGPAASAPVLDAARESAAELVVQADLRERDGRARVALRAIETGSGAVAAATLAEAALPDLGIASEQALAALLPRLGVAAAALPETSTPSLDELAAVDRAMNALDRGELARAWLEVEGRLEAMPMRLRESILAQVQQPGAPISDRARVLAAAGDGEVAWLVLAPEIERAPRDPSLLLAAAEVAIARRDVERARSHAAAAVRLRPEDPQALLALGRALELAGDQAGARIALERSARAEPTGSRAVERLALLDASDPPRGARRLVELATLEALRLEPQRAARTLTRAVELDPGAAGEAARVRGALAARMGRHPEALRSYEAALQSEGSGDPELLVGVGLARLRTGEDGAEQPLRLAVEIAPTRPDALRALAELETVQGRTDVAASLLERAVAAEPRNEATRVALARALAASQGPAQGLEVLTGAAAPAPEAPETLEQIASLERDAGQLDAARATLERALADWPEADGLRTLLAAVHRDRGDTAAAEALGLADAQGPHGGVEASSLLDFDELVLAFAGQVSDAHRKRVALLDLRERGDWRTELLRWLHPRTPDRERLVASIERSLGLAFTRFPGGAPESPHHRKLVDQLLAFDRQGSLDALAIAQVNQTLGTDAVFAARLLRDLSAVGGDAPAPGACAEANGFVVELRMLSGQHADVASILADQACLADGLAQAGIWNRRALAIYAALGLLVLFPVLRGWGTLVVTIKLPPRTRGFLHIRIGRKPQPATQEKPRRKKRDEGRLRRSLRSLSRFRKQMAGRETTFRWIPARKRSYFVTVGGPLLDAMGDEVIGHFLEEQRVRIERGKIARLVYDYCPTECAVEVRVLRDGQPAKGARAALRGDRTSIRYPRGGIAHFYLGTGTHTVVVGAGDRAAEKVVPITAIGNAIPVAIDLGDPEMCIVRNCAEAVEPYLLGDFEAAARALEMAGEAVSAHLLWGAHHQQQGDIEKAAAEFEAAGYFEEAAELRARNCDLSGSAALFEQAGDFARAAESHRAAGALLDAGRCYEQAYQYQEAIDSYREGGAKDKALDLMEKIGQYLEAAELCREGGETERAIRNLQLVDRRDSGWSDACRGMAELLALRGQHDLAAQKIAEAIDAVGGGSATAPLHELHADLLERAGRPREAIAALEELRRLDPMRDDLAPRIAALSGGAASGAKTALVAGAEAAAEQRYEILGEIGRGGMGVVMKARDLRLGRLVALKQMPEHLRENRVVAELFLREARAAAALNHRNIVTVYDAGVENGAYFISMELLEGLAFDKILERRGLLSVADVARLGIQVCSGLHYAHEQRIVHRDIKTANLFFTREKVVKIMDFGLAKTIEEVRRHSTVIGGTPYYMAPEQAAGEAIDARTDLYALGVTFFRMLTGTFPFQEGDLAYQHRHVPAPDPRETNASLPPAMAELVLALLAKAPDARPPDAASVSARLQTIRRGDVGSEV